MSSLRIAIVDSGLDSTHPVCRGKHITEIKYQGEGDSCDENGHGTGIFSIISSHLGNADAEYLILRLPMEQGQCDIKSLIRALTRLCDEAEAQADVVNLSLGVNCSEYLPELHCIIRRLTDRGTIVVAAFDNDGSYTYPAAFPECIGVVSDLRCRSGRETVYYQDKVINIGGYGANQRVAGVHGTTVVAGGSSQACGHITAEVALALLSGVRGRDRVLTALREKSIAEEAFFKGNDVQPKLFEISKAVLFPLNKEMHAVLRFPELLNFEVTDVFDEHCSGRVGRTVAKLLKTQVNSDLTVKDIEKIDWSGDFDTIILGNLDLLQNQMGQPNLRENLIEQAITYGKKAVSFDELPDHFSRMPCVYSPKIGTENLPTNRMGMLYRVSCPVLAICGTSSKQGKFTLQLQLRQKLLREGYRLGQLATEPHGQLFGIDHVFPNGYGASVRLNEQESILYLNNCMKLLENKQVDLVIVGSQSGSVPYEMNNLGYANNAMLSFLLGTQPDAFLLCINWFDDEEYIARTVAFLESAADAKVIGFVLYPFVAAGGWQVLSAKTAAISDEDFCEKKERLQKRFRIPTFRPDREEQTEEIKNTVLNYFS